MLYEIRVFELNGTLGTIRPWGGGGRKGNYRAEESSPGLGAPGEEGSREARRTPPNACVAASVSLSIHLFVSLSFLTRLSL